MGVLTEKAVPFLARYLSHFCDAGPNNVTVCQQSVCPPKSTHHCTLRFRHCIISILIHCNIPRLYTTIWQYSAIYIHSDHIMATCFDRKTVIIRPIKNIFKVQQIAFTESVHALRSYVLYVWSLVELTMYCMCDHSWNWPWTVCVITRGTDHVLYVWSLVELTMNCMCDHSWNWPWTTLITHRWNRTVSPRHANTPLNK